MHDGKQEGAIVLLSGGQDSTTCFAWALDRWNDNEVFPLVINYGQRHRVELDCARCIAHMWRSPPLMELPLDALQVLGGAALTDDVEVNVNAKDTGNVYAENHGLPSTFVPGRNLLFFTLAAAYGAKLGIYNIVTGVCETDDAGYPDCRAGFVSAAELAIQEALDEPRVTIHAPLLRRSKAETWALAVDLNVLNDVRTMTNTCYHGTRDKLHAWGYGCGECGACIERIKGWDQYTKKEARRLNV